MSPGGAPGRPVLPAGMRISDIDFAKGDGTVPVVVQDADDQRVLMLGYADAEAVQATVDTGMATFHSRSRGRLWVKGETSGNNLRVHRIEVDCDADALLYKASATGPTCHTGSRSCFDGVGDSGAEVALPEGSRPGSMLAVLDALVAERVAELPEGSYTTELLRAGTARIAQKVGEEGVEVALAAVTADDAELAGEAADLVYHLLVLLHDRDLAWGDVEAVLAQRHQPGSNPESSP